MFLYAKRLAGGLYIDTLRRSTTSLTQAIIVCNPGNPTGTVFSREELEEIRNRTIACYNFSKHFAMAGWRVGYMYAPAAVIEQVLTIHDAVMIAAPTISQYAALAALTLPRPESEGESLRDILMRRRDLTCERLLNLSHLFTFVAPRVAYDVLPRYLKTAMNSRLALARMKLTPHLKG
jgi:aminotransferase